MPRPDWIDDRASIPDDFLLWRGIPPDQIRPDGSPNVAAFITHELSVSIGNETTPEAVIAKGRARGVGWRLWEFLAGTARRAGCIVDRDRMPDDPAHAVVLRADAPGKRISEGVAKKLVRSGHWVT